MAIKTQTTKMGETLIVELEGCLDYETNDYLKDYLDQIDCSTSATKIIFNLAQLSFVGSSGISSFIHTMRDFNQKAYHKPKYTNVAIEFKKIISAFDESKSFDFWDSTERALTSIDN